MKSIPHQHLANQDNALNKKDYEMKSRKFGCGLALALLIPVSGAYAKSSETVLYSFTGGADGSNPYGALIEDASGNLYGTAVEGGAKGVGGGGKGEIAVENAFPNEARDAAEQNSGCYQRGRVAGAFGCHFSRRKLPATMESMPEE